MNASAVTASRMVVEATPCRAITPALADEIDALARRAAEPNPFHDAWMLDAALSHLDAAPMILLTVRDADGTLAGLVPLQHCARFRGLPIASLQSWRHDYLFLGSPLLDAGSLDAACDALLSWLAGVQAPKVLELTALRADGPIFAALEQALARYPRIASHLVHHQRALLQVGSDDGVSGKHRKELRRLERRLAECGETNYRALHTDEDAEPWIERFLRIEAIGWKGTDGTALGSRDGDRAWFTQVCRAAHRLGRLRMYELTLNGAPIAVKCNFAAGDGAFMFKIGYDERHARHSPGLLLERFAMQAVAEAADGTAWIDSCARGGHFMAERLWPARRQLVDCVFGTRGLARTLVRNAPLIHRIRRRFGAHGG